LIHFQIIQVLVYPSKNAISIEDFILKNGPIDRFVFLDATWFQVGGLRILPEIQNLPSVTLRSYKTQYWRPQKGHSDEHLATIEAVYYAIREVLEVNYNRNKNNNSCADHNDNNVQQSYNGQIDDLLYWFYYFHSKVPQEVFEKNLNGRIVTSSES
uniref:tRNA-uridine aminocarboxypropyltransferase 1 n=1 Tax=Anisakis simplex TaxID=6269 RepID=A0A0M3KH20_ANISI